MKTKRGSILVYALIILMMMTAISVIETKTTLFEKKSVGITETSTQAYQTSDSGAQMGIKLINSVTVADATLSDVFYGDYLCETDTEGYAIVEVNDTGGIMGSSYKLTFFDGDEDMGGNQLGCEDFINDIELIKSVGTHKDAVRAVEVSVNRTMLSDSEGSGDDEIGGTDPEDDGIGSEEPGDGETGGTNPCGETTTLSHGGLTYGTVAAEDGRCWLDRNLGATRVATAYNDSGAYGWYYQWGRGTDGHQVPSSEVSNVCSSTDNVSDPADTGGTVNDGKFITDVTCYPGALDWRNPKNDNLWQGLNGVNNVCPSGFRIPTTHEWSTFFATQGITVETNTCTNCLQKFFNTSLKIVSAGNRGFGGVNLTGGTQGNYWTSTTEGGLGGNVILITSNVFPVGGSYRQAGKSVRCIKD